MKHLMRSARKLSVALGCIGAVLLAGTNANAALLDISNTPPFLNQSAPPLNMLVMGRDHKLFTAAYNDASDLDGDGALDIGYKPSQIDYYGYFDSYNCYTYSGSGASGVFTPVGARKLSDDKNNKKCSGSNQWSGDFLNYVTTSRVDALRKVFYGGYRNVDDSGSTILQRAYIPQDAHSWGKEYQSEARDGYKIRDYTPLDPPDTGKYILFANTSLASQNTDYRNPDSPPLMRVMWNTTHRVWEWLAKEAPVAGPSCANPGDWANVTCDVSRTNYTVRVEVCKSSVSLEPNCQQYGTGGTYKPIGLLQTYGENNSMQFGLISGSYMHNHEGGVLRKQMGTFTDEIVNPASDGRFASPKNGLVATMDSWKIEDFDGTGNYFHNYSCSPGWQQDQPDGTCRTWGNPIGEMMFEGMRYFAGGTGPTSAYTYTDTGSDDRLLGAPIVSTWKDPYKATASGGLGYAVCAKPFETVVSDVNPSYDSELPGGAWGNIPTFQLPTAISSFNASTLGTTMWNAQFGAGSKSIYIGEVGATADGAPTPKTASSFGNIRGLSPEEPTRQGTYYSAAVSYFGNITDLSTVSSKQNMNTFSVALSSPLPKIEMPVGSGTISLVPFAKVVKGPAGNTATWQPTSQIVAFFVDSMANMPGQTIDSSINGGRPQASFRINFEDAEQGNDYDMDEIVLYTVKVLADNTLSVQLKVEYASAGYESHLGYIISGTDGKDGIYLEVAGGGGADSIYGFDTPSGKWAGDCLPNGCTTLPGVGTETTARIFAPGSNAPATLLKDPLWYAAKFGGFTDKNSNKLPDAGEWDSKLPGTPDNYFLVTNALTLGDQLAQAFSDIFEHVASASSASVNSGSISSQSRVYQAKFNSGTWTGQLLSIAVNPADGSLHTVINPDTGLPEVTPEWDASDSTVMPSAGSRAIITVNSDGTKVPFRYTGSPVLDTTRMHQLDDATSSPWNTTLEQNRVDYIRGSAANEGVGTGKFRRRAAKLGDIINSAPIYVGAPAFNYPDLLEPSSAYSTFQTSKATRTPVVYVGANDGMLHGFNANTGAEIIGFIPSPVFPNLKQLTNPLYTQNHQFYVDGSPNSADVFYGGNWHTVLVGGLNRGGQGIYALDVTNPSSLSEANASSVISWEFTSTKGAPYGDPNLGYTYSQPAIVKLHNGKWAAIFGNGYNNTGNGQAMLYIVDIETGALITSTPISTNVGTTGTPNGLSTPAVVDTNGDFIADYVYAGDLQGNLWKFDITSSSPSAWKVAYKDASNNPVPLFTAKDSSNNAQPITDRPEVSRGPGGAGMVILFGTGKFLGNTDRTTTSTQSFYGIIDMNAGTVAGDVVTSRSSLQQQTIVTEQAVTFGTSPNTVTANIRITSNNAVGTKGWYMDLTSPSRGAQGERVVSNPIVRNGRVIFTTLIPDSDPCGFGGASWLMELDAISGSRLSASPFDLNNDGKFDGQDAAAITNAGITTNFPVSGLQSDVGITPEPGILAAPTAEYKYNSGTTGEVSKVTESPGTANFGRQSWRQIR